MWHLLFSPCRIKALNVAIFNVKYFTKLLFQSKDRALADLEEHNQRLRAELRGLQDDLEVQEEELAYQQRELEELRQRCRHQEHAELHISKPEQRFLDGLSRDSSLPSPEALRRLDCSEERPSHLHASHLSELSGLRNTSVELTSKHSPTERNELKRPLALLPETDPPSTHSPSASPRSLSISENISVLDSLDTDKVNVKNKHYLQTCGVWCKVC